MEFLSDRNDVRHAGGELSYTPSPRSNARIILPLLGNRREPTRYFFSGGKKWNFCQIGMMSGMLAANYHTHQALGAMPESSSRCLETDASRRAISSRGARNGISVRSE